MMEQALNKGQQQNALELAQLAPVELKALLSPFSAANGRTIRRPCVFLTTVRWSRCARVLCGTRGAAPGREIFSGLTRFDAQSTCPIGDLAHHWEVSPDGLRWHFYIRSTLFWHNGDPIKTSQLQQRLLMLLQLPALRTLFASISEISVTTPSV
ncbi:oligopeptide ABC transporter [Klebsiella michiganensis]|uniref:Oligopeptide ABC transporter n=1 Tax=Klebsiella michiganensis TaxID=1134687 RepID=A0A7H4LYL7_9ENTR|nr:oligopeptide ABC transporter [Klebsiella michiganensis]